MNEAVSAGGSDIPALPRAGSVASMRADTARVPSLDGLRAVSILLVLFSHFVSPQWIPGGLGVLVFFVISGFLISRLMFAEWRTAGGLNIGAFYWRRFWRLYPAVVSYCIAVLADRFLSGKPVGVLEPLSVLLYFTNVLYITRALHGGLQQIPFGIFWSLSVEEHFYWIFPVVFAVMARGRAAWLARAMIWVCILCLALRVILLLAWPALAVTTVIYWSDLRLDSIAFGVLIASLCETEAGRRVLAGLTAPRNVAVALLGLAVALGWRNPFFRETLRYSMEAAAVAVLLTAILFSPRYQALQRVLNWGPLIWVGVLSYSLYVWHPLAAIVAERMFAFPAGPARICAALAASFLAASASYYLIEAPLRSRFAGSGWAAEQRR